MRSLLQHLHGDGGCMPCRLSVTVYMNKLLCDSCSIHALTLNCQQWAVWLNAEWHTNLGLWRQRSAEEDNRGSNDNHSLDDIADSV